MTNTESHAPCPYARIKGIVYDCCRDTAGNWVFEVSVFGRRFAWQVDFFYKEDEKRVIQDMQHRREYGQGPMDVALTLEHLDADHPSDNECIVRAARELEYYEKQLFLYQGIVFC